MAIESHHFKISQLGDCVPADYFCPPLDPRGSPLLKVIAFRPLAKNQTVNEAVKMEFTRTEIGLPWIFSGVTYPI